MTDILHWFNRHIIARIGGALALMTLILIGTIVSIFLLSNSQKMDTRVMNLVDLQGQRSQQMGSLALQAAQGDWTAARDLKMISDQFDTTLIALKNGDEASGIPAAPAQFAARLYAVENLWTPRKTEVEAIMQGTESTVMVNQLISTISLRASTLAELSETLSEAVQVKYIGNAELQKLAKEQSGLCQTIAQKSLAVGMGRIEQFNGLSASAKQFNDTLTIFIKGDKSKNLQPAEGDILQRAQSINRAWAPLYSDIQRLEKLITGYDAILTASHSLAENSGALTNLSNQSAQVFQQYSQQQTLRLQIFLAITGLVFMGLFAFALIVTRNALRPLAVVEEMARQIANQDLPELERALQAVADGDLTATAQVNVQPVQVRGSDETANLARSFNLMVGSLRQASLALQKTLQSLNSTLYGVQTNAMELNEASRSLTDFAGSADRSTAQIAASMQQLAAGISRQAESAGLTANTMEHMNRAIDG